MLHSLTRQHGLDKSGDCERLILLWHPQVPSTVLSRAQRDAIGCLAGQRYRVEFHQADDERVREWAACPTNKKSAISQSHGSELAAFLKLELFFMKGLPEVVIHFDADMLVLKSFKAVTPSIKRGDASISNWRVHGSSLWGARNLNTGFFAFRTPVPANVSANMQAVCSSFREAGKTLTWGDQDVLNEALKRSMPLEQLAMIKKNRELRSALMGSTRNSSGNTSGNSSGPIRRTARRRPPLPLTLSLNVWMTNYRPSKDGDFLHWRIAHWQGSRKPWTPRKTRFLPKRNHDLMLVKLNALWHQECVQAWANSSCLAQIAFKDRKHKCDQGVGANGTFLR